MDNVTELLVKGAAGAAGGATYVDDVFSTYLFNGNSGTQTITNGIDFAGEGGMVWCKTRGSGTHHEISDTVRGTATGNNGGRVIKSNENSAQSSGDNGHGFTSSGFTLGFVSGDVNWSPRPGVSWSFRKQKGFFDIVTYTGNATTRTISHSLGSVPGLILIKDLTSAHDWVVYHKSMGNESFGKLNTTNSFWTGNDIWNSTSPTSSNFTIKGNNSFTNTNGNSYVAYVFAGGESTAATARSVDFDGNDYLIAPASSDLNIGSSDFTCEAWVYPTNYGEIVSAFNQSGQYVGWLFGLNFNGPTGKMAIWLSGTGGSGTYHANSVVPLGQWSHVAFTKSGTTYKFYLNGTFDGSFTSSITSSTSQQDVRIGADNNSSPGRYLTGKISNLRITKGQVVYTDSFKPSTEPLTTTSQGATASNVKLLCCNNSSVTGATVIPTGSLSTYGDPTASTNSPFDDPNGFKFGEEGDQNIIKCGSYRGEGSEAVDVNIGWEPSWVMIKNASTAENWFMFDNMRGVVTGGNDNRLQADESGAEFTTFDYIEFNPTGFKVNANATAGVNGSGNTMTYIAIRRPDGYVGKPAEVGTDVFAMDVGNSNTNIPNFDSGASVLTSFPVDFEYHKNPNQTDNWLALSRLTGTYYVRPDTTDAASSWQNFVFDSNVGWAKGGYTNNIQSWMWKRHAGFDVVTDKGDGQTTKTIAHGLGRVPEMIWRKNTDGGSDNWQVYHIGLNGGTNPHLWRMYLNTTNTESEDQWTWTNAPTATHFTVGANGAVNRNNEDFITMLFASVEGISKVGYYDGTGSAGHVITTGFLPRLLIIRTVNANNGWFTYDTLRGLGAGADPYLQLQNTNVQDSSGADVFATSSTGFTINQSYSSVNASGQKYIYYAHA